MSRPFEPDTVCEHPRYRKHTTCVVRAREPLAGPLRAQINQLAHAHALQYELRLRASLLAQVQTARAGGASFADLAELISKMEAAPL